MLKSIKDASINIIYTIKVQSTQKLFCLLAFSEVKTCSLYYLMNTSLLSGITTTGRVHPKYHSHLRMTARSSQDFKIHLLSHAGRGCILVHFHLVWLSKDIERPLSKKQVHFPVSSRNVSLCSTAASENLCDGNQYLLPTHTHTQTTTFSENLITLEENIQNKH